MMSVVDDKVFEDQIERMKDKNQLILERFKASEDDRKLAESSGSAINKNQNVQIRLRNNEKAQRRNPSNPPQRPKSFHSVNNNHESSTKSNDGRQHGKFTGTNATINDEVAYQDYFHFQQLHQKKPDQNHQYNRSNYIQHNTPSYMDDNHGYKNSYRDYNRSASQKTRTVTQYNQNYAQKQSKVFDPSVYKLDNNKQSTKESLPRVNQFNSRNNSKYKLQNGNNQNVDPSGDRKSNFKSPQKTVISDEYIDDTLEDLERYRLKIDMEDFIVIDPESPDPILAMPLTPWNNATILSDLDGDGKHKTVDESSVDLLNNVNGRAKDYLNLLDQTNIGEHCAVLDHLATIDLSKTDGDCP